MYYPQFDFLWPKDSVAFSSHHRQVTRNCEMIAFQAWKVANNVLDSRRSYLLTVNSWASPATLQIRVCDIDRYIDRLIYSDK